MRRLLPRWPFCTFCCSCKQYHDAIFGVIDAIFGVIDAIFGVIDAIFGVIDAILASLPVWLTPFWRHPVWLCHFGVILLVDAIILASSCWLTPFWRCHLYGMMPFWHHPAWYDAILASLGMVLK
jgi:hypothetical protein